MGERTEKRRVVSLLTAMALVAAFLVPLVAVSGAGALEEPCDTGITQGPEGKCDPPCFNTTGSNDICCEPVGAAQGLQDDCRPDPCSGDSPEPPGVAQGVLSPSEQCCPDGSPGGFRWGGYAGQNRYWCEAPPYEPPATSEPTPDPTAEPTEGPAVSPTADAKKAAPKSAAAAAKPSFTG